MPPLLLVLIHVVEGQRARLEDEAAALGLGCLIAADRPSRDAALRAHAARVRVVLTNGATGLAAAEIDALPALTLLVALGAGHEMLAADHARARGIVVANGAGTNDDCVADHAMALLLASVRGLRQQDAACRAGVWRDALPLYPQLAHRRLGILGLGAIGRKIARRALGFDMAVGYHNRRPVDDAPGTWFDSPTALAQWCDCLVVATPGGPATRHLVDAAVLAALGPQGHLVNIARGSVVDTAALAAALSNGQLAGAALDVYESEPAPPAELLGFANLVLSPHVAGWSHEAISASYDLFFTNLRRHLAGEPVLTPL
jgi:lactate dehydrogenase-like 2-hydroxyacid dehydrogenase